MTTDEQMFAELAKNLKQTMGGFSRLDVVTAWYSKYYVTTEMLTRHHISALCRILPKYVLDNEFIKPIDLIFRLSPDRWDRAKFQDLDEDKNGMYHYHLLAECCNIIILTRVDRIPGYVVQK